MATADFNGDGKLDLVTTDSTFGSETLNVLLNITAPGAAVPAFSAAVPFVVGSDAAAVATADVNGDGRPDLVSVGAVNDRANVLVNTTAPGAAVPTFGAAATFPIPDGANSVAIADLNGDGRPDIAAAMFFFGTVSVLLNITAPGAAPAFSAGAIVASLSGPASIAAADVNGDGRPDLAIANLFGNSVSVLLNTTPPGAAVPAFSAAAAFGAGSGAFSVAIADLNGDGRPDLATSNIDDDTVSVLLNTAAPGAGIAAFSPAATFGAGDGASGVAIADLNGDGRPDLAVANQGSDNVSVLANTTTPGAAVPAFAAQAAFGAGNGAVMMAVADFNGDGKPDLAVTTNISGGTVSVLLNTAVLGRPTLFSAPNNFGAGDLPNDVALADLNGDGKPDLVVVNNNANNVSVRLNTTAPGAITPTFGATTNFPAVFDPTAVAIADLNGDGRPDLAVSNDLGGSNVSVLLNITAPGAAIPAFDGAVNFAAGNSPSAVAIADLNGDGLPDLVTANYTSNNVSVLLNTTDISIGTPAFSATASFGAGTLPRSVAIADLNGDGKPDLAAANFGSDNVSVLLNTTAPGAPIPAFSSAVNFVPGNDPTSVAIADLNGDGKPDLATTNIVSNNVSVLLNTTAPGAPAPSFGAPTNFTAVTDTRWVAIDDLNGDGKPDLAVVSQTSNTVSMLLNTTAPGAVTPTFSGPTNFGTGLFPMSVAIADLNGDGMKDLAVANRNDDSASILFNDDIPALTTTAGSLAYTENQPPTAIDAGLTLTDNSSNLISASVRFTAGYQNGQDVLACSACAGLGITSAFGAGSGHLLLTGTVTPASYQTALQSVTYQNTSDNPSTGTPRTVTFQVTDQPGALSNVGARGVAVTAVNDAPNGAAESYGPLSNAPTVIAAPGVLANDVDPDSPSFTATLVTNAAHGTVALQPNGGFTYTPDPEYAGLDSFTYRANDGAADGNIVTVSLSVGGQGLSIDDVTIAEGNTGTKIAIFTVTLRPAAPAPVTVQVQTQNDTATAGEDYVALPPTPLTFAPGETSKPVTVTINGDTTQEPNETFRVVFSDPVGAARLRSYGVGTITNDDSHNPRVQVQQAQSNGSPIPGRMQVTVTADTSACSASNVLQRIDFGAARNARVEVPGAAAGAPGGPSSPPGGPNGTPGNFPLAVNAATTTFFVQRQAAGDFKVDLAIVDGCNPSTSPFRTFVGGGAGVQ